MAPLSKTEQMDSVIADLTAVSKCSPATLRLLNDLLYSDDVSSKSTVRPARTDKAPASRTKSAANVLGMSPSDRERFATQVTNVTLNALKSATSPVTTTATNAQPDPPPPPPSADVVMRDAHDKENMPPRPASAQAPLSARRPKALNRVATAVGTVSDTKPVKSVPVAPQTGCMCVVECARAALTVLIAARPAGDTGVETAALTFVGRLLALNLYTEALVDLRAFRRRLDVVLAKMAKSTTVKALPKDASPADILAFGGYDIPMNLRPLVAMAQLHALRLLATAKTPKLVESSVLALRFREPTSPTQIVHSLIANSSGATATKYLRQLEATTKTILTLSPSWSLKDDADAIDHTKHASPVRAFEIQCVGLLSANLVIQHQGQASEYYPKVLVPLSKVFAALKRRGELDSGAYAASSNYYKLIKSELEPKMGSWPGPDDAAMMSMHLTLGSLAAVSGHVSEAVRWIQSVHNVVKSDVSSIKYTSVSAQLLAVMLKDPNIDPKTVGLSAAVVQGLDGTVKGEMTELEQLTLDLNTLRRRAIRFLLTMRQKGDPMLIENLDTLCLQFPRFAARWLGKKPADDASPKEIARFEQRRQLLIDHADSILDGCIMILKKRLDNSAQDWTSLNSTLQYCIDFLQRMGDYPSVSQEEGLASNQYVKISGLYFLFASKTRGIKDKTEQANGLKALRRCVEALNGRPANEKEKAKYTAKLEKLAESYKHFGHANEARTLLNKLCLDLAESGVLADVTALLEIKSPYVAWNKHGDARILSRALTTLAKVGFTDDSWMDSLSMLDKAALLEHRLHLVSDMSRDTLNSTRLFVMKLMDIYDAEKCHFRHLRSLVALCEQLFAHGEDCSEIFGYVVESRQRLDRDGFGVDEKLEPYLAETWANFWSMQTLRGPDGDKEADFTEAVSGWRAAVASAMSQSGSLEDVMGNPEGLLRHLGALREYAAMKGDGKTLAQVLELSRDICIAMAASPGNVLLYESMLGTHFLDVGDHSKAAAIFSRQPKKLDEAEDGSKEGHVAYYLASANYDIQRGDYEQAQHNLDEARRIFEASKSSISSTTRVKFTSEASHLYSVLALHQGDSAQALEYARTSVKIIYQLWSRFEQFKAEDTGDITAESTEELGSRIQSHGAEFWSLTPPMIRYLQRASAVYMYLGSFADTQYYAEQAYRVASSTGSARYQAQAACWAASVLVKGDNAADAEKYIAVVHEYLKQVEPCVNSVALACQLASMFRSMDKTDDEVAMIELANDHMSSVGAGGQDTEISGYMQDLELKAQLERENREERLREKERLEKEKEKERSKMSRATGSTQATRAKSVAVKAPVRKQGASVVTAARRPKVGAGASLSAKAIPASTQSADAVAPPSLPPPHVLKSKTSVILSQGLALINQKDYVGAYEILQKAGQVALETSSTVERDVACAMCLVGRALEKMVRDPVFSVVQDSTLSFPAICSAAAKLSDVVAMDLDDAEPAREAARPPAASAVTTRNDVSFVEDLREAQVLLGRANTTAARCGDSSSVYRVSSLLQTALIFLSATTINGNVVAHPAYTSSTVEYARNVVWKRERDAATCSFSLLTEWPPVFEEASSMKTSALDGYGDIGRFQADYVDILPAEWSAISLALSDNKSDLCITKLQAGHTPFVLRLPLERATSREMDVNVFDFAQGRDELLQIIGQCNDSCHSAKKMVDREARAEWRREREAIDERLEGLLANIEHLWLGGFRGIFSQHRRRTNLLAKFQRSFYDVLDKHLPSRRRIRGLREGAPAPVTLDPRILDLFVGLGDPAADRAGSEQQQYDIDEALTDLLYFVVDILQFHGERNAYDEIDFDAMIIDTLDALAVYHHAVGSRKKLDIPRHAHTILVLDKDLIPFPWESLPCMEVQAVSRVPSLAYLRRAILEQRAASKVTECVSESGEPSPPGHHVHRSSGTYMLNPGGDLPNTQARFEKAMQTLPASWTSHVTTAPTEAVFEQALQQTDVLVYMGHGSGAQYIRSKTVRRMAKLRATALLIGCSSARLTPAGAFEHHGTPRNFLLAGCPAVVGMLWDVTDREIDRYAAALMEAWGLLEAGTFGAEFFHDAHAKPPRKRYRDRGFVHGEMSLVEAVVEARKACTFRYMTAATVVVYGIPVYMNR